MGNVNLSTNGTDTDATILLLKGLLSGATLDELKSTHNEICADLSGKRADLEKLRDTTTDLLDKYVSADREIVTDVVRSLLANGERRQLPVLNEIVFNETPRHKNFPLLIAALRAQVPVWLWGDAGSGKTTSARKAAELLELPFRVLSVCPTTTKSELFGYRDATGTYHSTAFREIFEGGGVFLLDEIDNGNPSILSVLNTALANETCSFPDGNIKRHNQALFVAAANTIGRGADTQYVGRNALDATTLDRFVFIRMDIDENLEESFVTGVFDNKTLSKIDDGGLMKPKEWLASVQRAREICADVGIKHLVTPRATIYGTRLIAVGVGYEHLKELCLYKGLRETDRAKIDRKMKR